MGVGIGVFVVEESVRVVCVVLKYEVVLVDREYGWREKRVKMVLFGRWISCY